MQQNRRVVIRSDRHFIVFSRGARLESFHTPSRPLPDGNGGGQIGAHFSHFSSRDPHHQVHPVRANIGNRAQLATEFGLQPPVPIGRVQQPVLQKTSVYQAWKSNRAARHHRFGLMTKRVVAQIVGHSSGALALCGKFHQHFRFTRVRRQRFFAQHVLARAQQFTRLLEVQIIWRAYVRNAGSRIAARFFDRGVGSIQPQAGARFFAAFRCAAQHTAHFNSKSSQRVEVRFADKACSDQNRGWFHVLCRPPNIFTTDDTVESQKY